MMTVKYFTPNFKCSPTVTFHYRKYFEVQFKDRKLEKFKWFYGMVKIFSFLITVNIVRAFSGCIIGTEMSRYEINDFSAYFN